MNANEFLQEADRIMKQRASDRDVEKERSMAKVVLLFNSLHGTNLTEAQGWNFMVLLKMVRGHTNGVMSPDDYIDQIAYTSLEAESRA